MNIHSVVEAIQNGLKSRIRSMEEMVADDAAMLCEGDLPHEFTVERMEFIESLRALEANPAEIFARAERITNAAKLK